MQELRVASRIVCCRASARQQLISNLYCKTFIFFADHLGAVYMSPVCRDETLAGLRNKKRNLGGNMLTRIGLIRTSNS